MDELPSSFFELLEHIKLARGFDFSGYKRPTLERRIKKRMDAVGADDYATYLDFVQVHQDELSELFNTILINVTSLFRDPEAWEVLRTAVFPTLLDGRKPDEQVRAWSAGCASGEEAYTIVLLAAQVLGREQACRRVKVYATDVDEDALRRARRAAFSEREVEALPAGMLEECFERVGDKFELRRDLRRCVIFGRHDLIHDAPISRIDLLTCRNTIMYMKAETQEETLRHMHFALRDKGILMLGKAEMLLTHGELFTPLDLKQRIFEKRPADARESRGAARPPRPDATQAGAADLRLRESAFEASAVGQILVTPDGTLSLASNRARQAFGLSTKDLGRPLQDLEISYRPVELRSLIERACAERRIVWVNDVERSRPDETLYYDVQVAPVIDRDGVLLGAQVSFLDITQSARLQQQLRRTHSELESAFEELQSTGEELETTNEELQSTVEELETMNEELQSTNEELETMNEELQSTNQELQTLNDELRLRGQDLTDANVSLETILAALRAAVIVIDRDLHVQKWNAHAEEMWGLRTEEVLGRSLVGLDIGLPIDKLTPSIRACFAGDASQELLIEATNRRGRSVGCRVTCSAIAGDEEPRGAVIVIGEADGGGETNGRGETDGRGVY